MIVNIDRQKVLEPPSGGVATVIRSEETQSKDKREIGMRLTGLTTHQFSTEGSSCRSCINYFGRSWAWIGAGYHRSGQGTEGAVSLTPGLADCWLGCGGQTLTGGHHWDERGVFHRVLSGVKWVSFSQLRRISELQSSAASDHIHISQSASRLRHSRWLGKAGKVAARLGEDTYIAEVVNPVEDVDIIIGHDWVVPDMSGWGGGRHRLALTWKYCRQQQYRERPLRVRLDLPEVSSTLIVRLLSHEPISPLSAKRWFWNRRDKIEPDQQPCSDSSKPL